MQQGVVFNIQKYSLHDGPGIRTTVFLKGCPLRCWWCHNPESQDAHPALHYMPDRCVRCDQCVDVCPQEAPVEVGNNTTNCLHCGACAEACPTAAREIAGRWVSVDEVLATTLADRIFYDDSGGGVTFSGGEPLMQPGFLHHLLLACREQGLHTAVDTCGFAPREVLLSLMQLTDLVLYDIKTLDDDLHQDFTRASNRLILANLQALANAHDNIWLRIPVIPGCNDDTPQLDAVARFAAGLSGVTQVNLLPYHAMHQHKRETAGPAFEPTGPRNGDRHNTPPTDERLTQLAELFRARGLPTKIGG